MSLSCLTYAWQNSKAEGTDLLILLAFADSASEEDWTVWLGLETAARKARTSKSTVQRALDSLELSGEMSILEEYGSKYHTHIRRIFPYIDIPGQIDHVVKYEGNVVKNGVERGHSHDHQTSSITSSKPVVSTPPVTPGRAVQENVSLGARTSVRTSALALKAGLERFGMPCVNLGRCVQIAKRFDVDIVLQTFAQKSDDIMVKDKPLEYLLGIVKRQGEITKSSKVIRPSNHYNGNGEIKSEFSPWKITWKDGKIERMEKTEYWIPSDG